MDSLQMLISFKYQHDNVRESLFWGRVSEPREYKQRCYWYLGECCNYSNFPRDFNTVEEWERGNNIRSCFWVLLFSWLGEDGAFLCSKSATLDSHRELRLIVGTNTEAMASHSLRAAITCSLESTHGSGTLCGHFIASVILPKTKAFQTNPFLFFQFRAGEMVVKSRELIPHPVRINSLDLGGNIYMRSWNPKIHLWKCWLRLQRGSAAASCC